MKQLLDFLISTLKDTKGFVYSQAPDVVKQFIRFAIINSCGYIAQDLVTLVACGIGLHFLYRYKSKAKATYDCDGAYLPLLLVIWVLILVAYIVIACAIGCLVGNVEDIVAFYYCPKYFILKQLASMVH
jgi:hypothetical protein